MDVSRTILRTIRSRNIPLELSTFYPSSLRRIFPTRNILRPNTLTVALFPYLRHQPYATLAHTHAFRVSSLEKDAEAIAGTVLSSLRASFRRLWTYITFPLDLVYGECLYKQKALEKIRDDRAAKLGTLSTLRAQVSGVLSNPREEDLLNAVQLLQTAVHGFGQPSPDPLEHTAQSYLLCLVDVDLPEQISLHGEHLETHGLHRPSRLTRLWPRLVFLPPLALYLLRSAYVSRASLVQIASDALDIIQDFWRDWLLGPLKDVVKTVRAGTDDGVIITRESVRADLDVSLFGCSA